MIAPALPGSGIPPGRPDRAIGTNPEHILLIRIARNRSERALRVPCERDRRGALLVALREEAVDRRVGAVPANPGRDRNEFLVGARDIQLDGDGVVVRGVRVVYPQCQDLAIELISVHADLVTEI